MLTEIPLDTEIPFTHDWFGRPARYPAQARLRLDRSQLVYRFATTKPAQCDLTLAQGTFREGLWESDVAELFVMAPDGRYQEFNLSPTGAWWTATFHGYRQRGTVGPERGATIEAQHGDAGWSVQLTLDLEALTIVSPSDLALARWSLTAILNPEEPEYLCLGHHTGGPPDFHQASTFLPLATPALG